MIKLAIAFFLLTAHLFAFCFPCICSETTSSMMANDYLSTQTAALTGEIDKDIANMLIKTKNDKKLAQKSLQSIKKNVSTLQVISTIDKNTIKILNKILTKKQLELSLKMEQVKAALLSNKILIKKGE